jgi:hypothetical protein
MDRLSQTRWPKFEGVPAGTPLKEFLQCVSKQAGVPIILNERSCRTWIGMDPQSFKLHAMPALSDARVREVLERGLSRIPIPAPLKCIPRLSPRGEVSLEVLAPGAAAGTLYTIAYDVRDLLTPGFGAQNLSTVIRQSVGTPRDWMYNFNPVTGMPLNPVGEVPLTDQRGENPSISYLPNFQALQVKAPWHLQEGVRDYLRQLRVARAQGRPNQP